MPKVVGKTDDEILNEINKGNLVQCGVQTFQEEEVAQAWAEDAMKEGYVCIRKENWTELYRPK